MAMANYMHKGTTTAKIFKIESVSAGWYQVWLSQNIAKVIIKISSGTVTHDMTQEAWCTSYNLEASYTKHAIDMVKYGISEYYTSYEKTVEGS